MSRKSCTSDLQRSILDAHSLGILWVLHARARRQANRVPAATLNSRSAASWLWRVPSWPWPSASETHAHRCSLQHERTSPVHREPLRAEPANPAASPGCTAVQRSAVPREAGGSQCTGEHSEYPYNTESSAERSRTCLCPSIQNPYRDHHICTTVPASAREYLCCRSSPAALEHERRDPPCSMQLPRRDWRCRRSFRRGAHRHSGSRLAARVPRLVR